MSILLNSLLAGIFWTAAGLCGLTRHFLLEPQIKGYPTKPVWLQNVFFIYATILVFTGLRLLTIWYTGEASVAPPGVTAMGVFLAGTTFFYKGSLLVNTAMQFRPSN